jgi:predicted nucleic acid-binding Zn finger protein
MNIPATVLAKGDETRVAKAATSLRKGEVTITLTCNDGLVITAYVTNRNGQTYTVSLTENGGFCSCADYAYRAATCKHQVMLSLRVLQDGVAIPDAPAPHLTLKKVSRRFDTSMI